MVKRIFPWKTIFALFVHDALFRETIRMKIVKNVRFDIEIEHSSYYNLHISRCHGNNGTVNFDNRMKT